LLYQASEMSEGEADIVAQAKIELLRDVAGLPAE